MANGVRTTAHIMHLIEDVIHNHHLDVTCMIIAFQRYSRRGRGLGRHFLRRRYARLSRIPAQVRHIDRLIGLTDSACIDNLRMDRNAFGRLCQMLRHLGDLADARYVTVEEQVAMFLGVLTHHKKNRVVHFDFWRSGYTV